jgi:DNA-binding HxlR family transcriptional regulator
MAVFPSDQPRKAILDMGATIKRHTEYDRLGCPVEVTTEIIGGKWKGKIIYILLGGTKRFGELRRLVGTATQRMLTNQLRELERDGLVERKAYVETPPKVEYSLTKLGQELRPAIEAMWQWGKLVQDSLQENSSELEPRRSNH